MVTPFSLRDAPALIETQLPVNRISAEAYKERKAGAGQTLTALGSYWKGRKPLILVRAAVLGALLPAREPRRDLEIFLKLMGMHDASFARRIKSISARDIDPDWPDHGRLVEITAGGHPRFRRDLEEAERRRLIGEYLCTLPYDQRLAFCLRPEECDERLHEGIWDDVNAHLGTDAHSLPELVEQLGVMRFGHRPRVADTFCGGGSIPFEAARLGCDVYASDLNPIACMLTWGALNIIGADEATKAEIERSQRAVAAAVDREITALGIEHDGDGNFLRLTTEVCLSQGSDWKTGRRGEVREPERLPFEALCPLSGWRVPLIGDRRISDKTRTVLRLTPDAGQRRYRLGVASGVTEDEWAAAERGTVVREGERSYLCHDYGAGPVRAPIAHRAKAYLYCLETRCTQTGWLVPMAPSWVISKTRNVCAKLVPDHANRRYDIEIVSGASKREMDAAAQGTMRGGMLVHPLNPAGVAISVIRGDHKDDAGKNRNRLRRWERHDFRPRPEDIFQERLYCIQWIDSGIHARTWFASVTEADLERERRVEEIVGDNLGRWQDEGLVPDMEIEPGDKTDEPIRTRGWTYWHHLFSPRDLIIFSNWKSNCSNSYHYIYLATLLNYASKLCQWITSDVRIANDGSGRQVGGAGDFSNHVFYNQAFNTFYNNANRTAIFLIKTIDSKSFRFHSLNNDSSTIITHDSKKSADFNDVFISDPPYADAVHYHEITEYFIAWLRKNPPAPFDRWTWDSRRALAIKGSDEKFRRDMVAAYQAMAAHMPDNGLQIVLFTHQDAGVWADLAAIMWAAGLRVTFAWNIVTETDSALKKGNYVQGTILLILRKRLDDCNTKRMDIEEEVEDEVRAQLDRLQALDDDWTGERLYTDGDLQLAAYAAALRVITAYKTIDRRDVGADVYRKLGKGEKTIIRDLIDYASTVANNFLVPDGCAKTLWQDLDPHTRFYFRMLDMEAKGPTKVADYQNFAKTFGVDNYTDLMASTRANEPTLAGALDLKGRLLETGFGATPLRRVLFAIWKTHQKDDPKPGRAFLQTEYGPDYWNLRRKLIGLAEYIHVKTARTRPAEHAAAHLLIEALKTDRM